MGFVSCHGNNQPAARPPVGTEIGQCTQKLPCPLLTMALHLPAQLAGGLVVSDLKGEGALNWITDVALHGQKDRRQLGVVRSS